MRNLKKILALVLALVMSLSLMATASAADFTDASSISDRYATAVNVLEGLKVFKGYAEDNTFRPQGDITRAEVATIIYRIATGDVEDAQASIYTNMTTSFSDLDQAEWARGYVNYSHNAQIIKGEGGGKFNPNGKISGYATLAMILRTMGYGKNGEFEGTQWEITTAAKAKELGLIDNVMEAQLGSNASREMVAEILFRGMLKETVTYNALTGYQPTGKTLGKNVGLEDVVGVVVANEWANLEGASPLKAGKTVLKVNGKNRTVDVSTSGAEVGTSVHVYLKGEKVLADVEDAGTVIKTNEGDKISVNKLLGGLDLTPDTQYFVNYGEVTKNVSDWRLEYVVVLNCTEKEIAKLVYSNKGAAFIDDNGTGDPDNANLQYDKATESASLIDEDAAKTLRNTGDDTDEQIYTYNKSIRAGDELTPTDLYYMEEIFRGSDSFEDSAYQGHDIMNGEVYAATKSGKYDTDKSYDVSDELSWNQFCDKYLGVSAKEKISGANQGESLRIIDNDGDGKADYVLLVQFVMTTVKDYDKTTDSYLVEWNENDRIDDGEMIYADTIKAMEGKDDPDLSTKSVILYAEVDGVFYTTNPEVETMTIDKRGIDTKNDTFTVDGEKHVWSGIFRKAAYYYNELKELAEQSKYNFYLDYFGNARLACEPNKGFVLLTDGYYWSNRRAEEKKAELYDDEAGELIEAAVVDYKPSTYPNGYFVSETWSWGDDNDKVDDAWLRLRFFQHIYNGKSPFTTNVAAFATDGETYSLFNVTDKTATPDLTRNNGYNTFEIAGTVDGYAAVDEVTVKPGDVNFTDTELYGIETWNDDGTVTNLRRIQTTSNTQYYFVTRDYTAKGWPATVISWVGYKNVPAELNGEKPLLAYAVTYESTSKADYDVAEVVVFEEIDWEVAKIAWLVFAARSNTSLEYSLGIDPDGSGEYGDYYTKLGVFKDLTFKSAGTLVGDYNEKVLKFYSLDEYGDYYPVEDHFADYGIHVGTINTRQDVDYQDYITFGEGKRVDKKIAAADDLVEYRFVFDSRKDDSRINGVDAETTTRLHDGDRVIYMLNAKGEIALIINLDDSRDEKGAHIKLENIPQLGALYADIEDDAIDQGLWSITATIAGATGGDDVALAQETVARKGSVKLTLAGEDAAKYTIHGVVVEDGKGYASQDKDGVWYLTAVESNVTVTVTVEADATYPVTLNLPADAEEAPVTVKYTVEEEEVTITGEDDDEVPYGTTLTITTTAADATHLVKVVVNGETLGTSSANDTAYTYEVTGDTTITVTVTELDSAEEAEITALTLTELATEAQPNLESITDGAATYAINSFPYGTETTKMTLTVGATDTVKVWQGNPAAEREIPKENGKYTLEVGEKESPITYTVVVTSANKVDTITVTLKLEAEGPSDDTSLAAPENDPLVTVAEGAITIAADEENSMTAGQLKAKLSNDEGADIKIMKPKAEEVEPLAVEDEEEGGGDGEFDPADWEEVGDNEKITAEMIVVVTAEDGDTVTVYPISFEAAEDEVVEPDDEGEGGPSDEGPSDDDE